MAPSPAITGYSELLWGALAWTVGWTVLFYALSWSHPTWKRFFPESTKEHENEVYWSARNILGILHAVLISVLSCPALIALFRAPEYAQFPSSSSLEFCSPQEPRIEPWTTSYAMMSVSGLAFTTFTLSDAVVSMIHKMATWDYVIHHAAFLFAGMIIRGNCILPFNASVLMAMEVSTPFLNYMLFVRNRGPKFKLAASVCGVIFFFTYVIFRLFLNTYATVILWVYAVPTMLGDSSRHKPIVPSRVPAWQMWFLLVAVTAGAVVQLFWFPGILTMFISGVKGLFAPGTVKEYKVLGEGAT